MTATTSPKTISLAGRAIRLAGAGEGRNFRAMALLGLITAAMIIRMILKKRQAASAVFSQGLPQSSLCYRLAQKWHYFAIFQGGVIR